MTIVMVVEFRGRTIRTVHAGDAGKASQGRQQGRAKAPCDGVGSLQGGLLGKVVDEGNSETCTLYFMKAFRHLLVVLVMNNWQRTLLRTSLHSVSSPVRTQP